MRAEAFIRDDGRSLDELLGAAPYAVFAADSADRQRLAPGQYVFVRIRDNEVIARLVTVSDLLVYTSNDRRRVVLAVRRRENPEEMIGDADVRVNGRRAAYLPEVHGYLVRQRRPEDGLVRVCIPGDTTFLTLDDPDDGDLPRPWLQRLHLVGKSVARSRVLLTGLFHKPPVRYGGIGSGTFLFSQPKYKLRDTVRFKAYLLTRSGKRYRKPVDIYLEYTRDGSRIKKLLGACSPAGPGSFLFQFALSDTLPPDTRYTLSLMDKHGRPLLRSGFPLEEYLLDEVTDYQFRAEKETVYGGDSLRFLASAADAGGLPILDGKVHMVLLRGDVGDFVRDSVYIPDTLLVQDKPLATQGETVMGVDTRLLPLADMQIQALGTITDAAGERHDQTSLVSYAPGRQELQAETRGDSITTVYTCNGRGVPRDGFVRIGDKPVRSVHYPLSLRVDPMAEGYMFYLGRPGAFTDSTEGRLDDYNIQFSRDCRGDSLGFVLNNPRAIPVSYTVLDGNRVEARGWSSDSVVTWRARTPHPRHVYQVHFQYYWKGKEEVVVQTIWSPYRLLTLQVDGKRTVFPGQKDTLRVRVTDAKGRPDPGVDLAAYSYNTQFQRSIQLPRLAYVARYRHRPTFFRPRYTGVAPGSAGYQPLGRHQGWIKAFGLDSMTYYQMLYPRDSLYSVNTPQPDALPQLSVYAVRKGIPQRIYLLYLNLKLVYYDGATDPQPYAFTVPPAYVKIGLRLYDRYIELDSVYAQPFYRKSLVIDLDRLPAGTLSRPAPPYYLPEEAALLRNHLWQVRSTYETQEGYAWQGNSVVHWQRGLDHILGPFDAGDSLHFFAPGNFDSHFLLETGYRYELSPKILRLEKSDALREVKGRVPLGQQRPVRWVLGDTVATPPEVRYAVTPARPEPFLELQTGVTGYGVREGYGSLMMKVTKDTALMYIVLAPETGTMPLLKLRGPQDVIRNISPGTYTLLLVDRHFHTAVRPHVRILPNQLLCVHTEGLPYLAGNRFISGLADEAMWNWALKQQGGSPIQKTERPAQREVIVDLPSYPSGSGVLWGRVIDARGKLGVPGATIMVRGSRTGATTDDKGYFRLPSLKPGKVNLVVASVGYETKNVEAVAGESDLTMIALDVRNQALDEVVVIGYGAARKRSMTFASVSYEAPVLSLQGRVAGLALDSTAVTLAGATAKALRTDFRDYGFWQPRFLTDAEGNAAIPVTYPDNVTGWRNFVVGMDRSNRMGFVTTPVVAFKPLLASLSLPTFLVAGDSVEGIGKVLNYTADAYRVHTRFDSSAEGDTLLRGHASVILRYPVFGRGDSVRVRFTMQTGAHYVDGEQRSVPVYRKGVAETTDSLYLLNGDTTVTFLPRPGEPALTLYARNNTLDVLLDQLKFLKEYPYYCMEQTSSKLTGLLAEKKIKALLHQPFDGDKDIAAFTQRLEHGQCYSGGWGWWPAGEADNYMTCYVVRALLPLRADPLVEAAIRNGLLYLQNILPGLTRQELLDPLRTLCEAGHVMDYQPWLQKIDYDSLDQHGQWAYVRMLQILGRDYQEPLKGLLRKATPGMLGSLHWGERNWRWYSDELATTILAYQVLSADSAGKRLLLPITRFFLTGDYGFNTATCASVVNTLLPAVLAAHKDFTAPATLQVSGDTTLTVTHFPYTLHTTTGGGPWTIRKTGGGLTYVTLYQQHWESRPQRVDEHFVIHTRFLRGGKETSQLVAGQRVTLHVSIVANQDAEYTIIEVPIPAGCVYAGHGQDLDMHMEYQKDRVIAFARKLFRGAHVIDIPLEVRYSGRFALNPVQASLMYFPGQYGRDDREEVVIGR
jgi:hypothetical protein